MNFERLHQQIIAFEKLLDEKIAQVEAAILRLNERYEELCNQLRNLRS